jgi:3-oxoadipate enol-lactonase
MLSDELQRELSRLVDAAWVTAAWAAQRRPGLTEEARDAVGEVLVRSGLPAGGDNHFASALASQLRQAAAFATTGALPWSTLDDETLLEQGHGSRAVAYWLADEVLPAVGLTERLAAPGAAFLDVGVGVGMIATGLAERFDRLCVVGLDVAERSLLLAARAAADAGCADRVELRRLDVAALSDVAAYDLAWLPTAFLPEAAVRSALPRLLTALRPGGCLVVALRVASDLPVVQAIETLGARLTGGSALTADEVTPLLLAAGFDEVVELPGTPLTGTLLGARRAGTPCQEAPSMQDFALINGARLYYEIAGSGEPVLLLHTGNGSTEIWSGQFERFAEHHRAIRFDLRGFGRSDYPAGPFLWPADARDLLRYLDVSRAHVVAPSLGGRIGIELSLMDPDMVASLVLAAPVLREQSWREELMTVRMREWDRFVAGDFDGATEAMMEAWVAGPYRTLDEVDPAVVALIRRAQAVSYATRHPRETGDDQAGPEQELDRPAADRLAEVAAPTLVLVGDHDQPDCVRVAHQLAAEIPGAELDVVPGVAHMVTLERPELFIERALGWIDAHRMAPAVTP